MDYFLDSRVPHRRSFVRPSPILKQTHKYILNSGGGERR